MASKTNWRSTELDLDSVTLKLNEQQIAAIDALMERVGPDKIPFHAIRRQDFSHPALDDDFARLREEVMHGAGIVFIHGLPVHRMSVAAAESMFWGIGTHFGTGHSQSAAGDRMGHVIDRTSELGGKQSGRGYLSRRELSPHTDLTEILGMLSVRMSQTVGASVFGSAMTMFDIIAAEHPEYMPIYRRGFFYHRRGEEASGAAPITPYRIPLLSEKDGVKSCFYVRDIIDVAMRDLKGRKRIARPAAQHGRVQPAASAIRVGGRIGEIAELRQFPPECRIIFTGVEFKAAMFSSLRMAIPIGLPGMVSRIRIRAIV